VQHMAAEGCPGAHWERVARATPAGDCRDVKGTNVEVFGEREFRRPPQEFLSSIGDGLALVPWISIAPQTIGENSSCIANRMWPLWESSS
jgi:hypothetical protein